MERLTPEQAASALKAERRQFSQMELREVAARELVLRQWCVEKAIAACSGQTSDPVTVASQIWQFITAQTVAPNLEEKERP